MANGTLHFAIARVMVNEILPLEVVAGILTCHHRRCMRVDRSWYINQVKVKSLGQRNATCEDLFADPLSILLGWLTHFKPAWMDR